MARMTSSINLHGLAGILGLLAMAMSFLLPGHFPPWASFQQQWLAAAGALLIAVSLTARRCAWPWSPWSQLAMASGILPWLQWILGRESYLGDAVLSSAYLQAFGVCLAAGEQARKAYGQRAAIWLFTALMVGAALSVAAALLQWLRWSDQFFWVTAVPRGSTPFANLGQRNHLATLCAMAIAGTLVLHAANLLQRRTTLALLGWFSIGMILAQSRTGWLALIAGGLATVVMRRRLSSLPSTSAIAIFLTTVLLFSVSMPSISQALLLADVQNIATRLGQDTGRIPMWSNLGHAVLLSPWMGFGFNQVALAQQAAAIDYPTFRMTQDSHNILLDLAVWGGIPFAMLWILLLLMWARKALNLCVDAVSWWTLWGLVAIFIHALLEFPHTHTYFLFPMGLLMGWLAPTLNLKNESMLSRLAVTGVLTLLCAVFLWVSVEYIRVEESTRDLRFYLQRIGSQEIAPPPPEVYLLDMQRDYHWLLLTPASPGMSPADLERMRRTVQRFPYPPALMRYALAAGLNGQGNTAQVTLQRLCAMSLPARCAEGREAWHEAQAKWPTLKSVDFPSLPWADDPHVTQ